MPKFAALVALLVVICALAAPARAQDYPARPIKMVVPFPPGGAIDLWARLMADKLRDKWGQPVITENRAGAAGNIGGEYVARAAPDGYTLMMGNAPTLVINKLVNPKLAYDPAAFAPVSLVYASPFVLVARPQIPAANLRELIALAKTDSAKLTYGSVGTGTAVHLAGALFNALIGAKMLHVPYKGTPAVFTDMLGGQVDMQWTELGGALPYISSGKVRALAMGGETRSPVLTDVPAMVESFPGFIAKSWSGIVAPAGTPSAIVSKLAAAVVDAQKEPDIVKRRTDQNIELIAGTPAEMAKFLREESERWGNVIRITGTTVE